MGTPSAYRPPYRSRIRQTVHSLALLVGLPAALFFLLSMTNSRFGAWPATLITLAIGVWLSIAYSRRPVSTDQTVAGEETQTARTMVSV